MSDQKTLNKLEEIAQSLGTTVENLLESGKDPEQIVEDYQKGNLKLLND